MKRTAYSQLFITFCMQSQSRYMRYWYQYVGTEFFPLAFRSESKSVEEVDKVLETKKMILVRKFSIWITYMRSCTTKTPMSR